MKQVYRYNIDGIAFELAEETDMSFIGYYGKLLYVYDKNDSGNISFIVESNEKYFLKVAGLKTCSSDLTTIDSIENLRKARDIYRNIKHKNIVKPIKYLETDNIALLLFPYVEGECLFDHWNFEYYHENNIISPLQKFLMLDPKIRHQFVETLFQFYKAVNNAGYIATDFYEGSIIYNFSNNNFSFCDLDFFTKQPSTNISGFQWGPDRFLAPEERSIGQLLDSRTDVYHLGVFIRIIFTDYKTKQWQLSWPRFEIIEKAMALDPSVRFQNIDDFEQAWRKVI